MIKPHFKFLWLGLRLATSLLAADVVALKCSAQGSLSDRYKALPALAIEGIPGVPAEPEMTPAQVLALWDPRQQDVSDATLALVNGIERDTALYPRPVSWALGAVLKADYPIGIEWIVDHFGAFTQTGRTCIVNSLYLPCAEVSDLLVCLISDLRATGYPRSKELVPPFIDDRVCDNAYVIIRSIVVDTAAGSTLTALPILPDMEHPERDVQIAAFKLWWAANKAQVKAQLPLRLDTALPIKQKLDALILQLSAP